MMDERRKGKEGQGGFVVILYLATMRELPDLLQAWPRPTSNFAPFKGEGGGRASFYSNQIARMGRVPASSCL